MGCPRALEFECVKDGVGADRTLLSRVDTDD